MWGLALLSACAGHADPAPPAKLEVEGVVLTLSDETEITAEQGTVAPSGDGTAKAVVAKDGALEIQAPHTQWNLKSRTAVLSGGVVAKRGPVVLRCAEMTVVFSKPGRVKQATATGDVRIEHGDREGTATRAVLTTEDGTIVLTGNPVLTDGANRMSGTRIVLYMDADKVVCDACRMRIAAEAMAPGTGTP